MCKQLAHRFKKTKQMEDGRHFKTPKFLKLQAEESLAKAKEIEAQKRANGAHYVKTSNKTYRLQ